MVLPDSHRMSRVPWYSGTLQRDAALSTTGLSPTVAVLSRTVRLTQRFVTLRDDCNHHKEAPQHRKIKLAGHKILSVWAVPASLAATKGIENFFLFLRVLRCFSSPGLLP